jgi:uncharacterized protein with von Willebrand factor type A (vWA) domain
MFIDFFFALKQAGVPVSLNEWIIFTEALAKGLAYNSLTGFYYLARAILVKSEKHFDRYDTVFFEYFEGIETPEEISAAVADFLDNLPDLDTSPSNKSLALRQSQPGGDAEVDLSLLKGTLSIKGAKIGKLNKKHDEKTGLKIGASDSFGGEGEGGVRFEGQGGGLTAVKVAGQRKYKEYRDDKLTNIRQFEMALRSLRQLSSKNDGPQDELNLDATVEATGRSAGMLDLVWERPRKNNLKILIFMDSVGSITRYHEVCKRLFNAAHRTTHFKEIKFYYFHNCIYDAIYKSTMVFREDSIPTDEFLRTKNSEHRLIIVGDATMHMNELLKVGGAINFDENNSETGLTWLKRVAAHYPYAVWLNPVPRALWKNDAYQTIPLVAEVFPMFELNPTGLESAMKKIRLKNN